MLDKLKNTIFGPRQPSRWQAIFEAQARIDTAIAKLELRRMTNSEFLGLDFRALPIETLEALAEETK